MRVIHLFSTFYAQISLTYPHGSSCDKQNENVILSTYYMGVSAKTVEAWEAGRNQPSGTACRLLAITKKDPMFPKSSGIVL